MSAEKGFSTEKSDHFQSNDVEQVEVEGGRRGSTAEELTELSGIEATAASKAAWLISVTVSLGGFLFGRWNTADRGNCWASD